MIPCTAIRTSVTPTKPTGTSAKPMQSNHSRGSWQLYSSTENIPGKKGRATNSPSRKRRSLEGSHDNEPETQNGCNHNRKRGAADFAVWDEAIDSMRSRPRRSFQFLRTLMRRQRAKKEKKQQIDKRDKEKDHKPKRLARVAQPFHRHRHADPDKRNRDKQQRCEKFGFGIREMIQPRRPPQRHPVIELFL